MRKIFLTILMMTFSGAAYAVPVILAENTHNLNEGAGNNPYSFSNTIGAENFSLGGSYDITSISHVGHHQRQLAQPDSINWWIYGDAAGTPGTILFSGSETAFTTNIEGGNSTFDLTRYSIDLIGVTLGAGDYWVGFNNVGGAVGNPHWTFASGGTSYDGLSAISYNGGGSWSTPYPGSNMTFSVMGEAASTPVPEPGTLALIAVGLIGVTIIRRRNV